MHDGYRRFITVSSERERCTNIFFRQLRKVADYFLLRHAGGKHLQNIADGDTHAADCCLPAALPRLNSDDALVGFVHTGLLYHIAKNNYLKL